MQISSRFTIAVHVLIAIETFKNDRKVTSEFLASSANVNPTVIRRLLQQLKKADIVTVKRGSGGADIERPLTEITLLDVYNAVEAVENGRLFHFHENRIDEVATRFALRRDVPLTGFTVTFDIYRLDDGAETPDDGELLASCTGEFDNFGYHRVALDAPVYGKAGERLSVVV